MAGLGQGGSSRNLTSDVTVSTTKGKPELDTSPALVVRRHRSRVLHARYVENQVIGLSAPDCQPFTV